MSVCGFTDRRSYFLVKQSSTVTSCSQPSRLLAPATYLRCLHIRNDENKRYERVRQIKRITNIQIKCNVNMRVRALKICATKMDSTSSDDDLVLILVNKRILSAEAEAVWWSLLDLKTVQFKELLAVLTQQLRKQREPINPEQHLTVCLS